MVFYPYFLRTAKVSVFNLFAKAGYNEILAVNPANWALSEVFHQILPNSANGQALVLHLCGVDWVIFLQLGLSCPQAD
jgi:hypothetical protein